MTSPRSSSPSSSEGGGVRLDVGSDSIKATTQTSYSEGKTSHSTNAMSNNAVVPYSGGGTPSMASFNDIRINCTKAQSLIMRMQQSTNTQVGLPNTVRDEWFQNLKDVAQNFIQAQVAATKLEQMLTTEKAQLQGSLSAALNERDLALSQKESALQEVEMLRRRLKEVLDQGPPAPTVEDSSDQTDDNKPRGIVDRRFASWIEEQEQTKQNGNDAMKAPDRQIERYTTDSFGSPKQHKSNDHTRPQRQRSGVFREPPPIFGGFAGRRSSAHQSDSSGGFIPSTDVPGFPLPPDAAKIHPGSNLPREMALLRMSSMGGDIPEPGPNGFVPPVTPLARRAYPAPNEESKFFGGQQRASNMALTKTTSSNFGANSGYGNGPGPRNASSNLGSSNMVGRSPPRGPGLAFETGEYDPRSYNVSDSTWSSMDPSVFSRQSSSYFEESGKMFFKDNRTLTALIPVSGKAPLGPGDNIWNEEIYKVFTMVIGFVQLNCHVLDHRTTANLPAFAPRLWAYICSVTYPDNRQNAANHARFLLDSSQYRVYFITRLLIQYIVQQMWDMRSWELLSEDLAQTLGFIKQKLTRANGYDAVLSSEQRYALVEQRARTIRAFIGSNAWPRVRTDTLVKHLNRFKDIVAPFLNPTTSRNEATNELSVLVERCMRVSGMINMSPLSFQFIFNECGIKFSEQSHHPLNTEISPIELQARHWRIMSIITPGITYRNDTLGHVDPHFISKANVLAMQ